MPLRRPKETGRSLTAATSVVPLAADGSWKTFRFTTQEWQREAWRLYDIIGELRFLANWIGDSVSQAHLFITEVSETGEETGPVDDERIAQLAAIPLGSGATRDDNLRLAGIDLAVGGEAFIVAEGAVKTGDSDKWFVTTTDQIRKLGDHIMVNPSVMHSGGPDNEIVLRPGKDMMIRAWRPHPNAIDVADSPTRAAIPPLREIELLTKREFAELDSRLTGAGVWPLPEGIDFPRGDDDPVGIKGFMAYLQRAVATSMKDQSSASAMVPSMFTVPDQFIEHLDKLKPITFWSEMSEHISPMKVAAISRLANSFEIPSEILTGMAASNHWTAWAIGEEGIKRIKPYLAYIADALTRGWLQPTLKKMGVENPERYAFSFDTAPLAVRPNRLSDAMELYNVGLLSGEATIKAGAFGEDQMPGEEETNKRLVVDAVRQAPSLLGDPAIQKLLGLELDSPAPIESGNGSPSTPPLGDVEEDGTPDTIDEGPDEDQPGQDVASLLNARIAALRPARDLTSDGGFRATAKLAVLRGLELAGGRLTSPAERRHRYGGTSRHDLHTMTGGVSSERADQVLTGAWDHIAVVAMDLGVDPDDFRTALHDYTTELLMRGMAHSDDMLDAVLAKVGRHDEP